MTINIDKIQNVYPFSFSAYNSEDKYNNLCSQINDVCQISSILFRILIAGINTKQPAGFWLIVLHRRQFTSNCNNTLVQPCCEYFAIIKGKGKGSTVICKDCIGGSADLLLPPSPVLSRQTVSSGVARNVNWGAPLPCPLPLLPFPSPLLLLTGILGYNPRKFY